jgi:hypothetical protein
MAREYGKVLTRIWGDPQFRALSRGAQHLYMQLISQPDLSMAGVLTTAPPRWAGQVSGVTVADVQACLEELERARFTVSDPDTMETLVRSYVRNDRGWRSPKTMIGIDSAIRAVLSTRLKCALSAELARCETAGLSDSVLKATNRSTREFVEGIIGALRDDFPDTPSEDEMPPSDTPSELDAQDSNTPSDTPRDTPSDTPSDGVFHLSLTETEPEPEPTHEPEPTPTPENEPEPKTTSPVADAPRPDVDALLDLLDAEIQTNGNRPPSRTKNNHTAMRLLLDRDGYTYQQVEYVIRWSQAHEFWRTNILSASKLRKQFTQLVAQLRADHERAHRPTEREARTQSILDRFANSDEDLPAEGDPE